MTNTIGHFFNAQDKNIPPKIKRIFFYSFKISKHFFLKNNEYVQNKLIMKGQSMVSHKINIDKDYQIKLIDKITEKAIKKVEKEFSDKPRNYINEWFRYVEIVNQELKKHLN